MTNGQVITIQTSSNAEVSITNQGSNLVHADCDLAGSLLKDSNSLFSFDFQPKTAQNIPNPLGSDITLKCTITSTDASDVMFGQMVSGTGSVNGQTVPASGVSFTVKNGDVVTLSGSAGSEVSITNQGSNKVHADCDLAAAPQLDLSNGNSLFSFDFVPSTPKSIPNPLGSDITLKCTISTTDASDVMLGKMVSGTGSVNGQTVPASGVSFTVKNGDVVTLQGSAGSEVSITNQGSNKVHADCDLSIPNPIASPVNTIKSLRNSIPNSLFSFDFQPNTAQSIPNPLGSDITLKCTITSTDASDVMAGQMVSGTGSVNGQTVPAGGISFTVKNGDVVTLQGSGSSEVSITNQGSNKVHADCDLALSASNSLFSFDFQPNSAQSIPNPLGSSISLKCAMTTTDASDVLFGKMLSGTGSVNGQAIPAAGMSFTVKNGDSVNLAASAGSEVSITNQGSNKVHSDCDLASTILEVPNSLFSFDFQPKTAQSIPNPLGSDITLKCTITSTDASDVMFGQMISGTGSVNGQTVPSTGISFTVKNGDVVSLSSSAGSEVSITNQGSNKVHADCDLATNLAAPNSFLSFDFQPQSPKSIPNPVGVDLNLKCTIKSSDATDTLFGRMVTGSGSVNGQSIPASGLTFTVKNGDSFSIQSSAGSEVSIVNKGSNLVHADCDLAHSLGSDLKMINSLAEIIKGGLADQKITQMIGYMLNNLKSLGHYDFEPNVAQSVSNPLLWSITATCTLICTDASDVLSGKMLSGTGSFNGQTLPDAGSQITVKNGDTLAIGASGEAEVSITNLGASNIHADCNLALNDIEELLNNFNKSQHKKHHKRHHQRRHHKKAWETIVIKIFRRGRRNE